MCRSSAALLLVSFLALASCHSQRTDNEVEHDAGLQSDTEEVRPDDRANDALQRREVGRGMHAAGTIAFPDGTKRHFSYLRGLEVQDAVTEALHITIIEEQSVLREVPKIRFGLAKRVGEKMIEIDRLSRLSISRYTGADIAVYNDGGFVPTDAYPPFAEITYIDGSKERFQFREAKVVVKWSDGMGKTQFDTLNGLDFTIEKESDIQQGRQPRMEADPRPAESRNASLAFGGIASRQNGTKQRFTCLQGHGTTDNPANEYNVDGQWLAAIRFDTKWGKRFVNPAQLVSISVGYDWDKWNADLKKYPERTSVSADEYPLLVEIVGVTGVRDKFPLYGESVLVQWADGGPNTHFGGSNIGLEDGMTFVVDGQGKDNAESDVRQQKDAEH